MKLEESQKSISFLRGNRSERRQFLRISAISAACHMALFIGLIFFPDITPARRWSSSVVNVSLVSLPGPGKGTMSRPRTEASQTPEAKKTPKPTPEQKTVPEVGPKPDRVSVAETCEIKPKTSLKKKTFKAEKAIQSAIKNIEAKAEKNAPEKAPENAPDPLAKALANLEQKVEEGPPGVGTGVGEGGGGKASLDQMDIYKVEIAYVIQQNWAFSEPMVGGRKNLEARLVIKILPEGRIADIFFETKSGNVYFDDSVFKAVKKSDPLPPLPKGYRRSHYMVGLRFTPSGLN